MARCVWKCRLCRSLLAVFVKGLNYKGYQGHRWHRCQVAQVNDGVVKVLNVKTRASFHFHAILDVNLTFQWYCHWDLLNVCILKMYSVFKDLTCVLRWPYSKRTLGLCVYSLSPLFSLFAGFWYGCPTVSKVRAPPLPLFYANFHYHAFSCFFPLFLHAFWGGKK